MAERPFKTLSFGFAILIGLIASMLFSSKDEAKRGPLVLAASSMQQAMEDAATIWSLKGYPRPLLAFAGTPALAKQIEAGSQADILVSADAEWMDSLQSKNLVVAPTRIILAGNRLVLVVPKSDPRPITLVQGFDLSSFVGTGRLATADPQSVPAGKYAKAALEKLGMWNAVQSKIAPAENVRAALALVERGASPVGIVYQTDVRKDTSVRVAATFPTDSHPPIVYPAAVLARSDHKDARPFLQWLGSPEGQAVFVRHGFSPASR